MRAPRVKGGDAGWACGLKMVGGITFPRQWFPSVATVTRVGMALRVRPCGGQTCGGPTVPSIATRGGGV